MTTDPTDFENGTCVRTSSGRLIDPFDPDPKQFNIADIAHALARMPRFGGHLNEEWTVAQHCLAGMELVPEEHKLAFLLHDATEAYIMDMPRPLKRRMPEYKAAEDRMMVLLAERFGFAYPFHPCIKEADNAMLYAERNQFLLQRPDPSSYELVRGYRGAPFLERRAQFILAYKSLTSFQTAH